MVRPPLVLVLFVLSVLFRSTAIPAQEVIVVDGKPMMKTPDGKMVAIDGPKPGGDKPSDASEEPSDDESDGEKKDDGEDENDSPEPKVIRRADREYDDADPDELTASLGDDGRVEFNFRDQPWVELVDWLSGVLRRPIDWLELPADRVNLRSPGRYTPDETRDLFNRHLLARGFTILDLPGGLSVVKTDGLNPAMVPRVRPDDLPTRPPFDFVRVTLDAGRLPVDKAVEQLQPMMAAGGKLLPVSLAGRLEAIGAAGNLAEVADVLATQADASVMQSLAPEFKLRHVPAAAAAGMLEAFLGIDKKSTPAMTPEMMQQMQQMGQQPGGPPGGGGKPPEISVVANVRQNSVLVRAPPDRVAVAMEFLKRIDVPGNQIRTLSDVKTRVQVFRLADLDPDKLIEIVDEMNVLEPSTRLRADADNRAIIVSGSPADRYVISSLIERLDGSGRTLEVMPLRRLDPVEVAETIMFLMGVEQKDDDDGGGRRRYYWWNDDEEDDKNEDQFRVAANSKQKQILLWANDRERAQVESLLIKLGELPPPGGNPQTVRVVEAAATPETLEYLRQLKTHWSRLGGGELTLPPESLFEDPNRPPEDYPTSDVIEEGNALPKIESRDPKEASAARPGVTRLVRLQSSDGFDPSTIRSAADFDRAFGPKTDPMPTKSTAAPAPTSPITISVDGDGNLVLTGQDTAALDRLESLMLQMQPPERPYRVFYLTHASAIWMKTNLENYFKDSGEEGDSAGDSFFKWYWGFDDNDDEKKPSGLGTGAKMRIVTDTDTNTLVVSGASASQLKTIAELIRLWDVPEPVNKRRTRFTELVQVEFGKAGTIAETIKDAYRDLLSSNDKAFQQAQGGPGGGGGKKDDVSKSRDGSGSGFESGDEDGGGTDFSFKGKLSLGVDEVGNTILVSAEGDALLALVTDMIRQLDRAARPSGEIEVFEMTSDVAGDKLREALRRMDAKSKP